MSVYPADISLETALRCVGPGWKNILVRLYTAKPRDVSVIQVKEKFGTLRFYVGQAPMTYHKLIENAEDESGHTCEECGTLSDVERKASRYWIRTLCKTCRSKIILPDGSS